jgi:hypothetical protein
MAKTVSKLSEDGKVSIRNVRRDAMKQASKLEKDKSISEDELADLEKAIQELTDDYVKQARSCIGGCVTGRQSFRVDWPASAQPFALFYNWRIASLLLVAARWSGGGSSNRLACSFVLPNSLVCFFASNGIDCDVVHQSSAPWRSLVSALLH